MNEIPIQKKTQTNTNALDIVVAFVFAKTLCDFK